MSKEQILFNHYRNIREEKNIGIMETRMKSRGGRNVGERRQEFKEREFGKRRKGGEKGGRVRPLEEGEENMSGRWRGQQRKETKRV